MPLILIAVVSLSCVCVNQEVIQKAQNVKIEIANAIYIYRFIMLEIHEILIFEISY